MSTKWTEDFLSGMSRLKNNLLFPVSMSKLIFKLNDSCDSTIFCRFNYHVFKADCQYLIFHHNQFEKNVLRVKIADTALDNKIYANSSSKNTLSMSAFIVSLIEYPNIS